MKNIFATLLFIFLALSSGLLPAQNASLFNFWDDDENRAYLGIYSREVSDDKAELLGFDNEYGSYISRVIPNSAADRAGLQPFDYVYGVDEKRVDWNDDLTDLLEAYEPGDRVTIHYIRQGQKRAVQVELGERSNWSWSKDNSEDAFLGVSPRHDNEQDEFGVPVNIVRNSAAEEMGLRHGDLILSINDYPMVDWEDISTAIDNIKPGETIRIEYERAGERQSLSGLIRSEAESRRQAETLSRTQSGKAFLGIHSAKLSEEKAELLGFDNLYGSYVTKVLRGTAAESAGVQAFDYIYGVDAYRTGEQQDLSLILRKYRPGEEATLHLIRRQDKKTLPLTFGQRSDVISEQSDKCEEPFFGIRHDHSYNPERGVAVEVISNSTAEELGLENGDVITAINGYPIIDWEDISTAIDNMKIGDPIAVDYRRQGKEQSGSQPIKSYCDTKGLTKEQDNNVYFYDDQTWSEGRRQPSRMDLSDVELDMTDMSPAEAREMKQEYDIDMPTDNNLRIEGLKLFPNPSDGMFRLEFNLPQRGQTSIRIYNASGRQIYNYELGSYSGAFSDSVDISQNGTGSYFLEIRQEGKSVAKKIVLAND